MLLPILDKLIVTYYICLIKKEICVMDSNQLMLGIEGLIKWLMFAVKWSLITAIFCVIIVLVLTCVLYAMRLNGFKFSKAQFK